MLQLRHIALVAGLGLSSACTPAMEVTSQPVDVAFASSASQSGLAGYDPTFVRSFAVDSANQNNRTEFSGAACNVNGSGFSANVTTPAIVNLPVYGAASRAVRVSCSNGTTTETAQALPYNVTSEERIAAGANGGLIGVLVMAGVDAARDKSNDRWGYRDVGVGFEQ